VKSVKKASKPKDSAADQVNCASAEKWECVVDVTTCANSKGKGRHVWQEYLTLCVEGSLEDKMRHFKESHGACPKGYESRMGQVRAQEAARALGEAGISRPPSKPR
jgi:hypothetical protein